MNKIIPWFLASRPKTLTAAFTPIFVGTAVAMVALKPSGEKVNWNLSLLALLASIFIQIGTNFVNDALDFKKGADNDKRIGPKRVAQSGLLTPKQVIFGGFLSFFIAILFGLPLVFQGGIFILAIGIISLICGYLYTGGPYPLAYVGLGELFVILFFGLAAVGGVFYIHTGYFTLPAFVAGLQIGLLATVLISINNFRDFKGDKTVGKMTLAARFGKKFARFEIVSLFSMTYLLNIFWIYEGHRAAALLSFLSLPIAILVINGILFQEPSKIFNKYLGMSALVQIIFGILMGIGFIIG
ncbi:1,4-dihydroxy-2-naphthoate polyprenyltransferase [Silvanigrella aquatica]|nr:1,4-dihydroxy-2-naphthoate polyprenyltransferase [Silvanigrella aquatica]